MCPAVDFGLRASQDFKGGLPRGPGFRMARGTY